MKTDWKAVVAARGCDPAIVLSSAPNDGAWIGAGGFTAIVGNMPARGWGWQGTGANGTETRFVDSPDDVAAETVAWIQGCLRAEIIGKTAALRLTGATS